MDWPAAMRHAGRVGLTWNASVPGRYTGEMDYHLTGRVSDGTVDAAGRSTLELSQARELTAGLRFDRLRWTGPDVTVVLDELTAEVTADQNAAEVTDLHLPGEADLRGAGRFSFVDRTWRAEVSGTDLPVASLDLPPLRFSAAAEGAMDHVHLRNLVVEDDHHRATLSGTWRPDRPQPIDASLHLARQQRWRVEKGGINFALSTAEFTGTVVGSVQPVELEIAGLAGLRELQLGQHQREQVEIPIAGRITDQRVTVAGEPVTLLDGQWRLSAFWQRADRTLTATLQMDKVALARADDVTGTALELGGELSGRLDVELPAMDPQKLTLAGAWRIVEPRWGDFHGDEMTGRMQLVERGLELEAVRITQGGGGAEANALIDVIDRNVAAAFKLRGWPIQMARAGVGAELAGSGDLRIDVDTMAIVGPVDLTAEVTLDEQPLGAVKLVGAMNGRRVELNEVTGNLLDGRVSGEGVIDLDRPAASDVRIEVASLDVPDLDRLWPPLRDTRGRVDATFTLQHTDDPRAPSPMEGRLRLRAEGATYRGLTLREASATAYLVPTDDPEQAGGRWIDRLLLRESTWRFDEGEVELWGRVTRREQGWYYYAQSTLNRVDIAAVARGFAPQREDAPKGMLSGSLMITGPLSDISRRHGSADLTVTEADLANEGLIAGIYNLFNAKLDANPTGVGRATIRLDGSRVIVREARYRNRGLELELAGQLDDLRRGRESPVAGYAIAVSEVLPKVPLLEQVGDAFTAVQRQTNAVRFSGTWGEPDVSWTPKEKAAAVLRELATGQ